MTSTSSLAGSSLASYPSSRPRSTGHQPLDHVFEGRLLCLDVVHVGEVGHPPPVGIDLLGDVRADALDDLPELLDLGLERVVEPVHERLGVLGLLHHASLRLVVAALPTPALGAARP